MKHWDYIAIGLILWAVWYVDANGTSSSVSGLGAGFTDAWAQAIASFENVNPAYNNPGGLNMVGDAGSTPATGGGVIGIFSSLSAGFAALENTLSNFISKYSGQTLLNATAIYVLGPTGAANALAGGGYPANVVNEANSVATQLGVSVNSTLGELDGESE
jgi:hypothetical protein